MNLKILISTLILSMSLPAMGAMNNTKNIRIQGKAHYAKNNGVNKSVPVKWLLRKALRAHGAHLKDYDVLAIQVYAKSLAGKGRVILRDGHDRKVKVARRSKVGGFHNYRPRSFHKLAFQTGDGQLADGSKLRFNGNIKVRKIVAKIRNKLTKVIIPLGGELLGTNAQSVTDRVKLKKAIRDQGLEPTDYALVGLMIQGKSRRGKGKAKLMIEGELVDQVTLPQTDYGYGFHSNAPMSFTKVKIQDLDVPALGTGKWQMVFKGNNKVKKIVLLLMTDKPIRKKKRRFL